MACGLTSLRSLFKVKRYGTLSQSYRVLMLNLSRVFEVMTSANVYGAEAICSQPAYSPLQK